MRDWTPPSTSLLKEVDEAMEPLSENLLRALRVAFERAARGEVGRYELEATAEHVEAYEADHRFTRMQVEVEQRRIPLAVGA